MKLIGSWLLLIFFELVAFVGACYFFGTDWILFLQKIADWALTFVKTV